MQFSDSQDSYARLKVNDSEKTSTTKNVKFSIENILENVKLVVVFKDEFDCADISMIMATFEIFGLSKF